MFESSKVNTYRRRFENVNIRASEDEEFRLPILPRLIPIEDAFSHPTHIGNLLVLGKRSIKNGTFVVGQGGNVVGNEFDPMREHGQVINVNDARIGSVHAPDFEGIGPQLIRAENVSRDVGHHQRY